MAFALQKLADATPVPPTQSKRAHVGAWSAEESAKDTRKLMVEIPRPVIGQILVDPAQGAIRPPHSRRFRAKDPHFFTRSPDLLEDLDDNSETGRWEARRAAKFPAKYLRTLDQTRSMQKHAWEEPPGNQPFDEKLLLPLTKSRGTRSLLAMRVATRIVDSFAFDDSRLSTAIPDDISEVRSGDTPDALALFEDDVSFMRTHSEDLPADLAFFEDDASFMCTRSEDPPEDPSDGLAFLENDATFMRTASS